MQINTAKAKKIIPAFLLPLARYIYCLFQEYRTRISSRRAGSLGHPENIKKRILIYGVAALGMGGTEKNLQIIAKYLDRTKYDVYFMYGVRPRKLGNYNDEMICIRRKYLGEESIIYIPFDYSHLEEIHPYGIYDMDPHITDVIASNGIDLVITAGAGNAEFPLTSIACPIIFLNIFGIPNTINNIKYHVCISKTIAHEIADIVPKEKIKPLYIPTEGPRNVTQEDRDSFRRKLGIPHDSLVFGRIGRADDSIYDPIGIYAFERVVKKYPYIHYIIVSPCNILRDFVEKNSLPNVHLVDPIYDEYQVWVFHKSIDVLAHFRADGETFGLNIAESMICGNPVITHRSKIWNAHLEYLDSTNSFIADIDNVEEYADALEYFVKDTSGQERKIMGESAKKTAQELFYVDSYMQKIDTLIQDTLR